jgi:hypothetical protein
MISVDANALEAKFGNKTGDSQPGPIGDLYSPDVRPEHKTVPNQQGQIPLGTPVPPGVVIQQVVGRGMAVVPPQQHQPNQPAMAVVAPSGATRTPIGTIVEPSTSNPMTATEELIPRQVDPPVVEELSDAQKPKRQRVDLTQEILTHMWELGGEKGEECQKFYERSEGTLRNWRQNPSIIPMGAVDKFLKKRQGVMVQIAEELEPHLEVSDEGRSTQSLPNRGKRSVMLCTPVLDNPTLPFQWACEYLMKRYEIGHDTQADTMIIRSRNMLAKRFLDSGQTWSLWMDSDIVPPIGKPGWFRGVTRSEIISDEACSYEFLDRLLGHNKPIIGAVYASRQWRGRLIIQPEINPRSHEDKLLCNEIRRGTARGLKEVDWIGFGCALIHREVFLEIQRRFQDIAPKSEIEAWDFFRTSGLMGEDEAFCQRARACSIPIWLDTQLVCGHIGKLCFLPEHTAAVMAL